MLQKEIKSKGCSLDVEKLLVRSVSCSAQVFHLHFYTGKLEHPPFRVSVSGPSFQDLWKGLV